MPFTEFHTYLQHEKRASVHTVKNYLNDLAQCHAFMKWQFEEEDPLVYNRDMIRTWVVSLAEEKNAATTIHRKISTLRAYYRFAIINGKRKDNPCARIALPKRPKRLPDFIDHSATEVLMQLSDEEINGANYTELLEWTVVELLYATGIRLAELIELKEMHVDNDRIKVLGKRNKERFIPLTPRIVRYLNAYRAARKKHVEVVDNGYFLLLTSGKKLYPKFVYRLVNQYLSRVSTNKKKSPHVLRHTFATHLLNNGAPLGAIRELLGHSSLAATQVYTHNSIVQLKNIYKQAHPMG